MSLTKVIKSQAKEALKGFQGRTAVMLLLILLLQWGFNLIDVVIFRLFGYNVQINMMSPQWLQVSPNFLDPIALGLSVVLGVVQVIVLFPLEVGLVNWYLALTDRRIWGITYLFWPYENRAYFRSIGIKLNLLFKGLFYSTIFVSVPVIMVLLGVNLLLPNGLESLQSWMGILLLLGVAGPFLLFFLVFWGRYSIVYLLVCQKYQMTVRQAIQASVVAMKGNKWKLLCFKLSFFGWILPLLLLGAGWIWLIDISEMSWLRSLCLFGMAIYAVIAFFVVLPRYHMSYIMICRYFYEVSLQQKNQEVSVSSQLNPIQSESLQPEEAKDNPLNHPIVLSSEKGIENDPEYYL